MGKIQTNIYMLIIKIKSSILRVHLLNLSELQKEGEIWIIVSFCWVFLNHKYMIKKSQQTMELHFPEKALDTLKTRQKNRVSETIEPIDYEKTTLFFIKSKHAFREFKNHDYFQSQRCNYQKDENSRSTQFVEFPPPFGINNAYCFMRDQISKNYLKKHHPYHFKTLGSANARYGGKEKIKKQYISKRKSRSINLTLPNLNELPSQSIIFKPANMYKLRSSQESHLRQTALPLQTIDDCRNLQSVKAQPKINSKQYSINVIYMNKFQSLEKFGSLQIRVNIFKYIIKTFLKTKINYLDLTHEQLSFLLSKIAYIYETQRQTISYKDIINCKTTQQIFDVLALYSESSTQFKEIIRYFFVANEEVYTYQFDCIKDQIRYLINQETNSINNNEKVFVFDIKNGKLMAHLQQLIKYNQDKFVAGIAQNAYELFKAYSREKNSKKDAAERVRKWKNIIPNQTQSQSEFHHISSEKYQTLFSNAQKKRSLLCRSKKQPSISIKNRSFMDRDKLVKFENIFQ